MSDERPSINSKTIGVLTTAMSFGDGWRASLQFYGDQPFGDGFKTNKGREGGMITADNFPSLLRTIADFMEQEGYHNLADLREHVRPAIT